VLGGDRKIVDAGDQLSKYLLKVFFAHSMAGLSGEYQCVTFRVATGCGYKNVGLQDRRPEFNPGCHTIALCFVVSSATVVSCKLLVCKIGRNQIMPLVNTF
jgi:hypothetical protein